MSRRDNWNEKHRPPFAARLSKKIEKLEKDCSLLRANAERLIKKNASTCFHAISLHLKDLGSGALTDIHYNHYLVISAGLLNQG